MKFILFGTGDYYRRFRHWFADKEVVAVLDNDESRQGGIIDGYPVIAPDRIFDRDFDVVVILSFYITQMKKQLTELGVDENRIFHFYDLHDLFLRESYIDDILSDERFSEINLTETHPETGRKSVLLLSHDLSLGGPALALYHAAEVLKKAGYEVMFASMIDGELKQNLSESSIPVLVDERLQICTMKELSWTAGYDLLICNTINYHVFLSERDADIPVIWWLHDSSFFYEGIKKERLDAIDDRNLKVLSVGPVPERALHRFRADIPVDDLLYGVSKDV